MAIAVEEPAMIREGHIRDRTIDASAGSPKAWRNISNPIESAHEKGRLKGARDSHTHNEALRWAYFVNYRERYETALGRSARDSTDMDVVAGGTSVPISERMNTAIKELISIDSHMSKKDRRIVRLLCENHSLPEAVHDACGEDFTHTVAARVRDALDAMIDAMDEAKSQGYRYVRMTGT